VQFNRSPAAGIRDPEQLVGSVHGTDLFGVNWCYTSTRFQKKQEKFPACASRFVTEKRLKAEAAFF
jgi:hypothetical protein